LQTSYSIIIPIYNEVEQIPSLLLHLKQYYELGHEIIIIDDGSNDGSSSLLSEAKFIKLFKFDDNRGKGEALKKGLLNAYNEYIIIFDGDLELHPDNIKKLMVLDHEEKIFCAFANRTNIHKINSIWSLGNLMISFLFNLINKSNVKDALCCAKSFLKSDLNINNLKAKKFDIDVEITTSLVKRYSIIKNINIEYKRRSINQGKKLRIVDAFYIIKRILYN